MSYSPGGARVQLCNVEFLCSHRYVFGLMKSELDDEYGLREATVAYRDEFDVGVLFRFPLLPALGKHANSDAIMTELSQSKASHLLNTRDSAASGCGHRVD